MYNVMSFLTQFFPVMNLYLVNLTNDFDVG
jgi:hypothetical protein